MTERWKPEPLPQKGPTEPGPGTRGKDSPKGSVKGGVTSSPRSGWASPSRAPEPPESESSAEEPGREQLKTESSLKGAERVEGKGHTPPEATPPDDGSAASVPTASIGDAPTSRDALGFGPYVEAIASFLTNPATEPPLTLSIEGAWGSGKSSFMLQLKERLEKSQLLKQESGGSSFMQWLVATLRRYRFRGRSYPTVWFNAWRYDREDALWAAFALEFTRKLSQELSRPYRLWAHIKLNFYRFNWRNGWIDTVRAIFLWSVYISVVVVGLLLLVLKGPEWAASLATQALDTNFWESVPYIPGWASDWATNYGGVVGGVVGYLALVSGYLALVFSLLVKLKNFVGDPIAIDLGRHIESPNYESRVAFIDEFHDDFEKIVRAYAGDTTVYIFIDDIDRCEAPKAAELMQAINLMLSGDTKLIYIIGMDREKVAASVAVKNQDLLPYLCPSPAAPEVPAENGSDPVSLGYGYTFIEKFVQLPFRVPQPAQGDVERLLKEISTPPSGKTAADGSEARLPGRGLDEEGREILEEVTSDSERVRALVARVAPALDWNPRRVKQFLSLLRLRTSIAAHGNLLATELSPEQRSGPEQKLTPEQIGKIVAIGLKWPFFINDLVSHPSLLADLQEIALGVDSPSDVERYIKSRQSASDDNKRVSDTAARWAERRDLIELLRAGCLEDSLKDNHDLAHLNVESVLLISPLTR